MNVHTSSVSFPTCRPTKGEKKDLTVCIVVNGKSFWRPKVILNLSDLFLYTATYLNFMFIDNKSTLSCDHDESQL